MTRNSYKQKAVPLANSTFTQTVVRNAEILFNGMYSNDQLDNHFEEIVQSKFQQIREKYGAEFCDKIYLKDVSRMTNFFENDHPKAKQKVQHRKFKLDIINYLNYYIQNKVDLERDKPLLIAKSFLQDVKIFLSSKHGFRNRFHGLFILPFSILADAVIFLLLRRMGLMYIPILSILSLYRNWRKGKNARKEDKMFES